jgi:hypothetical protein
MGLLSVFFLFLFQFASAYNIRFRSPFHITNRDLLRQRTVFHARHHRRNIERIGGKEIIPSQKHLRDMCTENNSSLGSGSVLRSALQGSEVDILTLRNKCPEIDHTLRGNYATPNVVSNSAKECVRFLDSLFDTFSPANRSILSLETCIMDDLVDMSVPLIDFNTSTASAEAVLYAKHEPGTSPTREFVAFVRGRGGGKTRALCEMERYITDNYPDCLAISITFKCRWGTFGKTHKFTHFRPVVYYEVLARILSMYYGLPLETVSRMLRNFVENLDEEDVADLFEATVYHILKKDRKAHFILQVDESSEVVRQVSDLYPQNGKPQWNNYWEDLIITLLDEMRCGGLVMSALTLKPLGKDTWARTIPPIEYPAHLSIENILRIIWLPLFKKQPDPTVISKLKVLAAAVNGSPRLVSLVFVGIKEWAQENELTSSNGSFTDFIIAKINRSIKRYFDVESEGISPDSVIRAITNCPAQIHEENSDFFEHFISSVYINVLKYFPASYYETGHQAVPETTFLRIMGGINQTDLSEGVLSKHRTFYESLFSLNTGFESILKNPKKGKISKALHMMFYNMLRLKFCCLFSANVSSFHFHEPNTIMLNEFFAMWMVMDYGRFTKLQKLMYSKILLPPFDHPILVERFSTLLNKNPIEFLGNLGKLYRPEDYVQIISSASAAKGDCFDHLVILKTADLPILIFIDNHSASPTTSRSKVGISKKITTKLRMLVDQSCDVSDDQKILKAIRAEQFIIMITSTSEAKSAVLDKNCVVLGQESLRWFLNLIWPVYQTAGTTLYEDQ